MKRIIATAAVLLFTSIAAFCQFSDIGYKNIKLDMKLSDVKKLYPTIKVNGDGNATVNDGNVKLEISFLVEDGVDANDMTVWTITSSSPNAKLQNIISNLIGMKYDEVKKVLGNKLVNYDASGPNDNYYIYYATDSAKKNERTSCVLYFENKVLKRFIVGYNP